MLTVNPISVNAATPAATPDNTAGRPSAASSPPRSVILVSGDRLTVHGDGKIAVAPRAGIQFFTYRDGKSQFVIPSDAMPLLRAGTLDRRLFDVNALLDARYDTRDSLGLIVSGSTAVPKSLKLTKKLPAVRGYAAKADKGQLSTYWKALKSNGTKKSAGKVWLDGVRKPSLDVSVPQIGAPAAWQAGFDGTGVTVAVLDTGIDATHPDLVGKIGAAHNFATEFEDSRDLVGHGTHVASTIAGSGAASGGKYKGVAPGATLLDGKVCVEFGCAESWILDGMQWAAESGADVINMSLGGEDFSEIDPLEQAVNDLTAQYGTLFVIAAGNAGPDDSTVGSPASADAALAVGAVDKDDELAYFSSRGLRVGDGALKPEITAPGVEVVAANSKDGFLGEPGESYTTLSGTSMATPHVAGAAAILAQQHPDWTPQQQKAALMASADPNPDLGAHQQGAGRVDLARAISQSITTSPAAVSFGIQVWPHDDDEVLTETVTYDNPTAADITLSLALHTGASGTFSLSTDSVIVPAGGQASVTITADTRTGDALGYLGGQLTATAGTVRVQTPFAVEREVEKFIVDLVHTGRDGNASDSYLTIVQDLSTGRPYFIQSDGDGTSQIRLPAGEYFLLSWLDTLNDEGEFVNVSQLVWPIMAIGGPLTVDIDSRVAKGFDITLFDKTVKPALVDLSADFTYNGNSLWISSFSDDPSTIFSGHLGPKPVPGFISALGLTYARPSKDGGFKAGPVVYNLSWVHRGSMIPGVTDQVTKDELAKIEASYAKHASDTAWFYKFGTLPDFSGGWAIILEGAMPMQRTEYVSTNVNWQGNFEEFDGYDEHGWPNLVAAAEGLPTAYEAGTTYQEQWNQAVFGPTLPESPHFVGHATRREDVMVLPGPLFGDSKGRAGYSVTTDGGSKLFRNGELVETSPYPRYYFEVPAEESRYRFEMFAERDTRLSTRIEAAWEFTSAYVDGEENLPLSAVGFAPELDQYNYAKRNAYQAIPVNVWQHPDSGAAAITALTVEVSFDDGQTWQLGNVLTLGDTRTLLLRNPNRRFVSLRVVAEDAAGNKVEQTIIRAYGVK